MASQEVKQQLIWHVQNRKRVKQMYKRKGIQMLDKPELMFSDIKEPKLNPQQASMYQAMKIELTEKGYSDFRFLGQGAQGLVLLAKDFKNQMRYAIKGVQVRDLQGNLYDEVYNKVKQEIDILKQCRGSPYVVSLLDSFEGKQFMYLVLNECQGTLTEIIESKLNKRLNEISAIKYAKDITEGLYYIHSKNCLVNDLKMDNILIDYNGNAVVSDFGLADKLTVKSGYSHNQYMGNFIYQAPECYDPTDKIIGKVYYDEYQKLGIQVKQEPSNRSEACSLGYIIYSLIQGIDFNLVFNKHKPLNYDGEFQNFVYKKNLQELIDGLTQFVPRKRLPIKEALIVLKGIISLEFQLDELLIQMIDGDTQKLASSLKNEIEFIQDLSNQFYPIIKNQQNLIQELKEDPEKILLEAKLAELEQANFMLKETISQSEEKTKALIDKLQKQEEILKNQLQNNTQKKMKGFMKQVRVNVLEVQKF